MDIEKMMDKFQSKKDGPFKSEGRFVTREGELFAVAEAGGDPREEERQANFIAASLNLGEALGRAFVESVMEDAMEKLKSGKNPFGGNGPKNL
ncbi:MAG: hypothetical protein CMJ75_18905 [Planctomycetaceae bacterium]|nr:hypothetical protein [Planctomycetaceae bacterium]